LSASVVDLAAQVFKKERIVLRHTIVVAGIFVIRCTIFAGVFMPTIKTGLPFRVALLILFQ